MVVVNKLILGTAGLHLIIATVQFQVNTSGGRSVRISIVRDGSQIIAADSTAAPTPATATPTGAAILQVSLLHIAEEGDEVQVQVQQSSGADLFVNSAKTMLQIARLAQ